MINDAGGIGMNFQYKNDNMNNYLETALSLILIFFIFSIIAYIIQEILAVNFDYRGRILWQSLAQLIDKVAVQGRTFLKKSLPTAAATETNNFYDNPEIRSLKKNLSKLPSYIPAANFALAVMDMVSSKVPEASRKTDLFDNVKTGLASYVTARGDIFAIMKNLAATSADIKEFQQKLEDWYNEYMNRVTRWYKSHTVVTIRLIAVGITLFFNINVIKLTKEIFSNAQLRESLSGIAVKMAGDQQLMNTYYKQSITASIDSIDAANKLLLDSAKTPLEKSTIAKKISDAKAAAVVAYNQKSSSAIDTLYSKVDIAGIPLGWGHSMTDGLLVKDKNQDYNNGATASNILMLLLGWFIAAGCISMGAPFWFDMLVKLVNVRRSGLIPATDDNKK
jgi:hypothetical protein